MKRAALLVTIVSLLLVSCGLKVSVEVVAGSGDQGDLAGATTDAAGNPIVNPTAAANVTGPDGPTGVLGTTTGPAGALSSSLFPNETEGVTKDALRICAHVPITGAAPIPHHPDRFGQFYFSYVNKELGGVYGRQVRFTAFDDKYYPAGARDAVERCNRLGSFVYFGAAGTDQIVSVAKWAERKKVPYIHGPTSIKDLGGFNYNIHAGPTYEYQHELLAKYVVNRFTRNVKYGMIRVNSPYFDAGHDAYKAALAKLGVQIVVDKVVQKDENQFTDVFFELQSKGVKVINNFTTPNLWLKMLRQKPAGYDPWWTAVSPVAGFNIVAQALSGSGNAVVFHHFGPACYCTDLTKDVPRDLPWYNDIQEFLRIFRKYSPEQRPDPDDFDYASYLTAKGIYRLLLKLGPAPTRTKLWTLLQGQKYKEDAKVTFPACPGDFTRNADRMGAWFVNVFELKLGKWRQIQTCVDSI